MRPISQLGPKAAAALEYVAPRDPRIYQIGALTSLLAYGWLAGAFELNTAGVGAIFAAAIAAQFLGSLLFAIRFEARSALITALSLTLLLRADAAWTLGLAAAIAVGSKFALRLHDKHVFNPANAGIVATLLISATIAPGAAWTTPGQWGTALWFAALLAGVGFFITYRASRLDVPLIFLGCLFALSLARAVWLGDPFTIPLHRFQNGALILFAFFMISDPKTTPDGPRARAVFAVAAAGLSYWFIYHQYTSDGFFYALAIVCAVRPLIELFDRAPVYEWPTRAAPTTTAPATTAPATSADAYAKLHPAE